MSEKQELELWRQRAIDAEDKAERYEADCERLSISWTDEKLYTEAAEARAARLKACVQTIAKLAEEWRERDKRADGSYYGDDAAVYGQCADELAAILTSAEASEKGEGDRR